MFSNLEKRRKKEKDLEFPNSERKKEERKRCRIWNDGTKKRRKEGWKERRIEGKKRSRIYKFEIMGGRKEEMSEFTNLEEKKEEISNSE